MRLLVALFAVALVAASLAIPQVAGEPLLTDPEGDVQASAGPDKPPAPWQNEDADAVDLLALEAVESEDALAVTWHVKNLQARGFGGEYHFHFDWNGVLYRAAVYRYVDVSGGEPAVWGSLDVQDGTRWQRVAPLTPSFDEGGSRVFTSVPRAFILDAKKHAPAMGETVTGVLAMGIQCCIALGPAGRVVAFDFMPDTGGVTYTFALGDSASGSVQLDSPDPIRVSNGGSTTFVYEVVVRNTGASEDSFAVSLADLPPGWNATVKSPVKVPGSAQKTITVLASVPFEHTHGGFDAFNVTVQSEVNAGSRARLRLGVLHTPVPQPAGHHPDLFLHAVDGQAGTFGNAFETAFPFNDGYMNTESAHEGEREGMSQNFGNRDGTGWWIPLNPSLAMGLDFDLNREGEVVGTIDSRQTGEGLLLGRLYLFRQDRNSQEGVLLADSKPQAVTLDPQGPTAFKIALTPTAESDYVAYEKGQNMVLVVTLRSQNVNNGCCLLPGPLLRTADFKLSLPLNEYNDELTGIAEAAAAVELVAVEGVERLANPGTIVLYSFDLKNAGFTADTFQVEVAGTDARRGEVIPETLFELGPRETKRILLAVDVPGAAVDGETLEVLLFAHSANDPSKMAIARTKTTVTTKGGAVADQTGEYLAAQQATNPASGIGALALVAGLAASAIVVGRRR